MDASHQFRVIVVGGGVAGLTASHCLQKAGIKHIVIEKGLDPAPAEGASIAIYPHGARILDQIGCLKASKAACVPMNRFHNRGPDGKILVDSSFFDYVKDNFGEDILLLERRKFLEVLYESLPDKSCILHGQRVVDIVDTYEGVTVHLGDGTSEVGDLVIGCDGVHSTVRDLMWRDANIAMPGLISASEKTSISTSWSCLIGMGPPNAGMGAADMTCVHNDGFSFLILSQPDKVFFFVFFRLDAPFAWPQRRRYGDEDAEKAAASVAGYPVSDSVVFGELWRDRSRGAMISLEEGILEHWFFGRTVLAGDAAHKITPNIALGGNSSLESIVVLTNHLHTMLMEHNNAKPSRAALNRVFKAYQAERIPRMHGIMNYSSLLTKLQAWDNPLLKFAANWIVPYCPDRLVADDLSKRIIATAPKLDFVRVSDNFGLGAKMSFADDAKLKSAPMSRPRLATAKKGRMVNGVGIAVTPAIPQVKQAMSRAKKDAGGDSMRLFGAMMVLFSIIYWMINAA